MTSKDKTIFSDCFDEEDRENEQLDIESDIAMRVEDESQKNEYVELADILSKSNWENLSTSNRILVLKKLCDESLNDTYKTTLRFFFREY